MQVVTLLNRIGDKMSGIARNARAYVSPRHLSTTARLRDKARIWVVGPTGVGKTTLINTCLGDALEGADLGAPSTVKFEWRLKEPRTVAFADTQGIEMIAGPEQVAWVARLLNDTPEVERPHVVWLCVRQEASRVFGQGKFRSTGTEAALAQLAIDDGLPCVGVLTQAEEGGLERAQMIAAMRAHLPGLQEVVPVCARDRYSDRALAVRRHGLDHLRHITLSLFPVSLRQRIASGWPPIGF